jgi:hypothetical protein
MRYCDTRRGDDPRKSSDVGGCQMWPWWGWGPLLACFPAIVQLASFLHLNFFRMSPYNSKVEGELDICSCCLDFDLDRLPSKIFAFTSVVAAAESGCKRCRVLLLAVEPYKKRTGVEQFYLALYYLDSTFICRTFEDDDWVYEIESFEIFAPIAEEFSSSPRDHNPVLYTS